MKPLVKNLALATIFSLAVATTASAIELKPSDTNTTGSTQAVELPSQIAQVSPSSRLNETRSRRFIDEMIMLHMKMIEAAESALQSPDPEVKNMARETIKSSNNEIGRMMKMREKFYRYEDG